jgi:DNA-directed RNA polymerase specialized sigma24 family protein
MRIFKRFWQEQEGEGAPAQRTAVQTTGVRRRSPVPPAPAGGRPCASFHDAYDRHGRLVWSLILHAGIDRATAPDVLQNVFLRLHLRILENDGVVPHPVLPVLFGLVEDEVRNARRARKRRREDGEPPEDVPTSKPRADDRLGDAELAKKVAEAALAQMSQGDRELLTMAHAELSIEDIAAARGSTVDAAWVALRRARQRFVELGRVAYKIAITDPEDHEE